MISNYPQSIEEKIILLLKEIQYRYVEDLEKNYHYVALIPKKYRTLIVIERILMIVPKKEDLDNYTESDFIELFANYPTEQVVAWYRIHKSMAQKCIQSDLILELFWFDDAYIPHILRQEGIIEDIIDFPADNIIFNRVSLCEVSNFIEPSEKEFCLYISPLGVDEQGSFFTLINEKTIEVFPVRINFTKLVEFLTKRTINSIETKEKKIINGLCFYGSSGVGLEKGYITKIPGGAQEIFIKSFLQGCDENGIIEWKKHQRLFNNMSPQYSSLSFDEARKNLNKILKSPTIGYMFTSKAKHTIKLEKC